MNTKRHSWRRSSRVALALVFAVIGWEASVSAVPSHVATTFAQTAATATTISVTPTIATTGDGLVVTLFTNNSCTSDGTITQTVGPTLTLHVTQSDGDGCTKQYSNDSVTSGSTTVTFTWTNTSSASIFATEISGQATSSAFDASNTEVGSIATTHQITATGTLAQASEIAIAVWNLDGSGPSTPTSVDSGFTIPTNGGQAGGSITGSRGVLAFVVTAATTGVGVTLTSANAIAQGVIGTYKAAGGGGTPCTPRLTTMGVSSCGDGAR